MFFRILFLEISLAYFQVRIWKQDIGVVQIDIFPANALAVVFTVHLFNFEQGFREIDLSCVVNVETFYVEIQTRSKARNLN